MKEWKSLPSEQKRRIARAVYAGKTVASPKEAEIALTFAESRRRVFRWYPALFMLAILLIDLVVYTILRGSLAAAWGYFWSSGLWFFWLACSILPLLFWPVYLGRLDRSKIRSLQVINGAPVDEDDDDEATSSGLEDPRSWSGNP